MTYSLCKRPLGLLSTLNAAAFNAVGDFALKQGWADGSPQKIALHAVVGGLLNEAAGGDFKTGALAAGANEALINHLAVLVKNDSNLLSMSSQLVGVAAAAVSNGNVQQGSTIARDATNYNYLLHHEVVEMLDEQSKCKSDSCRDNVREKYASLDEQRNKELSSLCQTNISACNEISAQLQADEPKIRQLAEQLRHNGDIGAAVNVGWIIAENNQAAQNIITTEVVVQRDGPDASFWALAAETLAGIIGTGKPGKTEATGVKGGGREPVANPTSAQVATADKLGVDPRWVKPDGSPDWPTKANNGFDGGFNGPPTITELQPGHTFDRYGGRFDEKGNFTDQGKFVAPIDVPFDQRALPDSSLKSPYRQYEVLKPIPEVNSGSAAPWFGKPGMGTQYQLPMSIDELVKEGFIRPIK